LALKTDGTIVPGPQSRQQIHTTGQVGFFWWQGDKDRYDAAHAARYEQNLVRLIKQLRKDFNAPKAKFVPAT